MPKAKTTTGLSKHQVEILTQPTPPENIKKRKGRMGKTFDYVPHYIVARLLNEAFDHAWSFEVEALTEFSDLASEFSVKGRLTVHGKDGQPIIKEQFGQQDLLKNKQGKIVMSTGDALKGAGSDALKKCASLLGIALDMYEKPISGKPGAGGDRNGPPPNEGESTHPAHMTAGQAAIIRKLVKHPAFSQEEKETAEAFAASPKSQRSTAEQFIGNLRRITEERTRTEEAAITEEQAETIRGNLDYYDFGQGSEQEESFILFAEEFTGKSRETEAFAFALIPSFSAIHTAWTEQAVAA